MDFDDSRSAELQKDQRLSRMITFSAVLHAAVIVCLIVASTRSRSSTALPAAYTVELVNPAGFGTNLPAAPVAKPTPKKVAVPEPEKPKPPAPKSPEPPVIQEKTPPKPEPQQETPPPQAKDIVKLPQKDKPVKKPQVKPPEQETKPAPQKPPVKKVETKPQPSQTQGKTKPPEERVAARSPERPALSAEERDRYLSSSLERIKQQVKAGETHPSGIPNAAGSGPPTLGGAPGEGGGGLVRGLAFIMYTEQVKRRVKESWIVAEQRPGLIATVRFGIEPDGAVFGVQLIRSSGDGTFDQSVLRAVRKADPLPPPPDEYRYEFATQRVEVTFGDENRAN